MAALALTQHTSRYAGLDPEAVWNAGMTAIISAFVISRLLLVLFNFGSFLQYPLLLLALPSLTGTGVLLTGLFMLVYLRWRRLSLLPLLDAVTPSAALLWASANLGYIAEGTKDGMTTHLPWGVRAGTSSTVHPVEIYTLIAAILLCFVLLRLLQAHAESGTPTAIALIAAGLGIFFIDFFRLPSDLLSGAWLDPAQIIGVAMLLIGALLLRRAPSKIEAPERNETTHAI